MIKPNSAPKGATASSRISPVTSTIPRITGHQDCSSGRRRFHGHDDDRASGPSPCALRTGTAIR